jgi:hypothetical protein
MACFGLKAGFLKSHFPIAFVVFPYFHEQNYSMLQFGSQTALTPMNPLFDTILGW